MERDMIKEITLEELSELIKQQEGKFIIRVDGHLTDFDISDNASAQVPSVSFIETEHKFSRNIKLYTSIFQ